MNIHTKCLRNPTDPFEESRTPLTREEFDTLCDLVNEQFEAECMRVARLECAARHDVPHRDVEAA